MPLAYLLLGLYCLALMTAPAFIISLYIREAKLRRRLNELVEENARQHAALQRAVGQLQSKMATTPTQATAGAEKAPEAEAHPQIPVPRSFPAVPIPPAPVVPAAKPAPPPPHIEAKPPTVPPPRVPPAPGPPITIPPAPITEKKPAPVPEQKPPTPVPVTAAPPAVTPATPKPPVPVEPKPITPPSPPKVTPPATVPYVPRPSTAGVPPTPAARISTPSPTSLLRVPASQLATAQAPAKRASSIEELLGANWFVKIGVFMLVIGVALLGKIVLQNIGPAGTAAIIFAVAFALLGGGIVLEKRERYQLFGRIAIGGGWALLFFATWAIHFLPAMHVVDSSVVDAMLMLVTAIAMGAHTLRYKSQLVTGFAFLVAYATIGISQDTVYSLSAGVMLAIGLVAIVLKMRWYELEVFGILSSYLTHLYWLYTFLGIRGAHGRPFPEFNVSLTLLFFYWLIFRISYVARKIETDFEEHISTVAAVLNTLLLLGLMKFQSVNPELAYLGLLAVGVLEFSAAQLPIMRKRRRAFVLLSILGAALMIAAVPAHYSGYPVGTLWLVAAEVFLAAGILFKEVVFRRIGLCTGLLVGVDLIFFNFRPLIEWRSHGESPFIESGIHFAFCAVVLYINSLYVSSRWEDSFSESLDRRLLDIQSYLGSFAAASAAWAVFSYDWTAVAFAALILALAALNRRLESVHLPIQYGLLGLLALFRVLLFNLHADAAGHTHITARLITLPLLGAVFYATAWLSMSRDDQSRRLFRVLFSFAGAGMFGALIWFEAPEMWIASLFLLAGILIAFAARRWNVFHLSVQEHLFAAAAAFQTIAYNFHAPGAYGPLSMRLITVSLVAAGLYAISRRATNEDAPHSTIAAYLHTSAATSLLAMLMWYETAPSSGWLAALWALFALTLTLVDRRFEMNDLRWQAHALALLTMLRCVGVNIVVTDLWHGISVRLISLAAVAVIFYAMALLIRMPDELRARDFHHIYSWAASFLGSLLLWYELDAVGRAVGLAAFGLVLFEYGFLRKIAQFRYQAYVAFLAAFGRIFFANLTAGEPGELFGPRMYTVLPIIVIFFFVYAQLSGEKEAAPRATRFNAQSIVAYLGSATLAALFYFQFDPEWVVASYAALAFGLFGTAWALKNETFLHQGILATLGVFARGVVHNLFGSSYFTGRDWSGRYLVLSITVAVLMAALFFAFRLREAYKSLPRAPQRGAVVAALAGRPELLLFFTSVILVTVMLALKNSESMITVSWGIEALVIVLLALVARERVFLHAGFGLLLLCAGKTFAMDMWRLDLLGRTITFIGVGLAITVVSLLYIRYQDHLKRYL